jgi:hypothetical protein
MGRRRTLAVSQPEHYPSGSSSALRLSFILHPLSFILLIAGIFAQAVKTASPLQSVKTRDFPQSVNLHGAFFRCFLPTLVYFIYVPARVSIPTEELTRDRQESDRQDQQRQALADPA